MSPQEQIWYKEYFNTFFNATEAARRAGYNWPNKVGAQKKQKFAEQIAADMEHYVMSPDEALARMASAAKFNLSDYLIIEGRSTRLDVEKLKEAGYGWMIKGLKYTNKGGALFELWDSQRALEKIFDNVNPALGDKERPIEIKVTLSDD
jgi:hypothetical protein